MTFIRDRGIGIMSSLRTWLWLSLSLCGALGLGNPSVAQQPSIQQGADPNGLDQQCQTPLIKAAAAGQSTVVRALLAAGCDINAKSKNGTTALIEAADRGQSDTARLLIAAGANTNINSHGLGTALEAAERAGHSDIAQMLREAGAYTSGHSVGDTVCVLPWSGAGFCGVVRAVNKIEFRIRVTEIIGCEHGCRPKPECSSGRPVGGVEGLKIRDNIQIPAWCLTETGVAQ